MPSENLPDRAGLVPAATPGGVASPSRGGAILAAGLVLASLFGPLAVVGLWDPYELRFLELARRIALNAFGAGACYVEGADNSMMTLGHLGSGELPYTSAAAGLWLFGLRAWAGRLPLALWALLGVVATYRLVARFEGRRAGAYAAIVLATAPLYVTQARTLLGDAPTLALDAAALAALAVAVFGGREGARATPAGRAIALALGGLALAGGYACRGAILGVAVPALGIGIAWLIAAARIPACRDRLGLAFGALVLGVGAVALVFGVAVLGSALADPDRFYLPVGARIAPPSRLATFDLVLGQLAHGLFPYGGPALLAVGAALGCPSAQGSRAPEASPLRLLLVTVTGVAVAAHGALAPSLGPIPFVAVAGVAALLGLAVRDAERRGTAAPVAAMGLAAATVLVLSDLVTMPEKGFVAYGLSVEDGTSVAPPPWLSVAVLGLAGAALVSIAEPDRVVRPRFDPGDYVRLLREAYLARQGQVALLLLVAQVVLIGLASVTLAHGLGLRLVQLDALGTPIQRIARWGWLALPGLVLGLPAAALLARDAARWLRERTGWPRARLALAGFVASAVLCGVAYFPTLTAGMSPRSAFAAFRQRARSGEEIAVLGFDAAISTYYLGARVAALESPPVAFTWLTGGTTQRYLAVRSALLPELNALHRGGGRPGNLPVVDARSSGVLLVSDRADPAVANRNPLDELVLGEAPRSRRPLDAVLGSELAVPGWEVTERGGRVVDAVVPGRAYVFRIYWQVLGPVGDEWDTFIHIDGQGRRFNGDHATLRERYPMRFWRAGDVILDAHPFTLEPNFAPGDYDVYFGLFQGGRRFPVRRGLHDEDRLIAGKLRVR